MTGYHIAQLNVGRIVAPLDSPQLEGFTSQLAPINALADRAPGFVWRLQDEAGDATSYHPLDDENFLINLSVWESIEALWDFVYRSAHLDVMRNRRQWFERLAEAHMVLWWVPAGHIPTIEEAMDRLERLRAHGPSPEAFTFKDRYPAPQLSEAH
ncbi:MAG TPA: DUF3291 domain-containing protein [Natronosporangium sp.]